MDSIGWRRIGAVLLILGGLLEAGALGVGTVTSPPTTTPLGASLRVALAAASVCIGFGLIATGVSLAGRGRTAVKVAGVVALIAPIVNAVQSPTGAPLGPAPSQAAYLLYVAAVVVAAARLLSNTRLDSAVRWSVAVPATCFVLSVVTLYLPPLFSPPGIIVLPWFGTAAAGVLLLRSWRRSRGDAARPVEG